MNIKQVVVTGQNQVELQDLKLEERNLGAEDFLVETEYSFISAGTELANYSGREPKVFQPGSWCAYPWRSGYSNVGIVRAVGSAVTRVTVGQRVFTFGPHASFMRSNQQNLVVAVPAEIDPAMAAASRMAGVATTAMIVAEIGSHPWVVVFGLGMVGNLAAQSFRIRGCRVIGVDPTASRRELAKRCGVHHVIGGDAQAVQQAIRDITNGNMADISVDAVGHSKVVLQALNATASHGQLILLGTPRVAVDANITELLSEVHLRWVTLRGALEWCLPVYPPVGAHGAKPTPVDSLYSKQMMIFDWIQRGELKLECQVSHRLPPARIKEAYDGLLNDPEAYTGVVLDWR